MKSLQFKVKNNENVRKFNKDTDHLFNSENILEFSFSFGINELIILIKHSELFFKNPKGIKGDFLK